MIRVPRKNRFRGIFEESAGLRLVAADAPLAFTVQRACFLNDIRVYGLNVGFACQALGGKPVADKLFVVACRAGTRLVRGKIPEAA
jgi:hypothetical protein